MASLVEAERTFARTSVEKGMREAFFQFFAEDGINFQPHPTKVREAFRQRPAPPTPPAFMLNWEPIYGDVAQAGDLGYTTGPYVVTDKTPQARPPRHGVFFSVWRKQPDGTWRVVVDMGIQTPAPARGKHASFQAAPRERLRKGVPKTQPEAALAGLLQRDREFGSVAQSAGVVLAFERYLSPRARLHRNGFFPMTSKREIRTFFSGKKLKMTWEPLAGGVSLSADLGYTYGRYELEDQTAQPPAPEKGYYVRVWKRQASGAWRVVLDCTNPIPPENRR